MYMTLNMWSDDPLYEVCLAEKYVIAPILF